MDFRLWLEATGPYIKKLVDPALLTFPEFYELVNPRGKGHPNSAYDYPLSKMTDPKSKFPTLLYRKPINGITFEFRLKKTDLHQGNNYIKSDEDGNHVRIDGELQYFTPEELKKLGYKQYEFHFSVFHENQQIASAQDEWGCLLFVVAQEYRGFGIGPMLAKIAWEAEPGKDTGGCTPRGYATTKKTHTEFVREYLQKGMYSHLVSQGILTNEKVQAILASVNLKQTQRATPDYNMDNPENWLLFNEDNIFILYDKKMKDLIDADEGESYWQDKAIKGLADIGPTATNNKYRLRTFGAENEQLKKFMLLLALSWQSPIFIDDDDKTAIDEKTMGLDGHWLKLKAEPIKYQSMVRAEKKFRKEFDKYDEFKVRLIEIAVGKYGV